MCVQTSVYILTVSTATLVMLRLWSARPPPARARGAMQGGIAYAVRRDCVENIFYAVIFLELRVLPPRSVIQSLLHSGRKRRARGGPPKGSPKHLPIRLTNFTFARAQRRPHWPPCPLSQKLEPSSAGREIARVPARGDKESQFGVNLRLHRHW